MLAILPLPLWKAWMMGGWVLTNVPQPSHPGRRKEIPLFAPEKWPARITVAHHFNTALALLRPVKRNAGLITGVSMRQPYTQRQWYDGLINTSSNDDPINIRRNRFDCSIHLLSDFLNLCALAVVRCRSRKLFRPCQKDHPRRSQSALSSESASWARHARLKTVARRKSAGLREMTD